MADLAFFDRLAFGRIVRRALTVDGRGYRALAAVIGVTSTDLSRAVNAKPVAVEKVFALADWAGIDARAFYANANDFKLLQSPSRETSFASRAAPLADERCSSKLAGPAAARAMPGGQSPAVQKGEPNQ